MPLPCSSLTSPLMAPVVTPWAARLVAPTKRVARPATAPSVQREIFIRWVFPRGVNAFARHLSVSHAASEVECVGSPNNLWRDNALVARLSNGSVTAMNGDVTRENEGRMSEDNVWRESGVGEIVTGTKRSLLEHREHASASRRESARRTQARRRSVWLKRKSAIRRERSDQFC